MCSRRRLALARSVRCGNTAPPRPKQSARTIVALGGRCNPFATSSPNRPAPPASTTVEHRNAGTFSRAGRRPNRAEREPVADVLRR